MQRKCVSKITKMATAIVVICGLGAVNAWADDEDRRDHDKVCTNRTLEGDYGFTIEGLLGVPGDGVPLRGVVLQHFDGKGHLTSTDHIVINGAPPVDAWRPGYGTYTVNPDCTGTSTIVIPSSPFPPLELYFVIAKEGREVREVVEGNAIVAVGDKVR